HLADLRAELARLSIGEAGGRALAIAEANVRASGRHGWPFGSRPGAYASAPSANAARAERTTRWPCVEVSLRAWINPRGGDRSRRKTGQSQTRFTSSRAPR